MKYLGIFCGGSLLAAKPNQAASVLSSNPPTSVFAATTTTTALVDCHLLPWSTNLRFEGFDLT